MVVFDWIKIISGLQSGADYGGLLFGLNYDIEAEANFFKDFRPYKSFSNLSYYRDYPKLYGKSGNILDWIKVNNVCDEKNYINNLRCRTKYNVKNSDITLVFIQKPLSETKGSKLTVRYCKENNKPYMIIWFINNLLNIRHYSENGRDTGIIRSLTYNDVFERLSILYNNIFYKERKLIINVAGERMINEVTVMRTLEQIFDY